jgi:hypothetical protein
MAASVGCTPDEIKSYTATFESLPLKDARAQAEDVRLVLTSSGLQDADLEQIWCSTLAVHLAVHRFNGLSFRDMCDTAQCGSLTREEFIAAMHLSALKVRLSSLCSPEKNCIIMWNYQMQNHALPSGSPPNLTSFPLPTLPSNVSVMPPTLTLSRPGYASLVHKLLITSDSLASG